MDSQLARSWQYAMHGHINRSVQSCYPIITRKGSYLFSFCSRRIGAAFVGSSYVAHICWSFLFQLLMSFTSFDVGGRGALTHSATSTPFFHPTSVGQRELFWVGTVIQVPSIFVRLK